MHAQHDRSRPATAPSEPILLHGDGRASLSGAELLDFPAEDRTVTVACASGTRHTATWTGIPIFDLFADVGLDDETTHLVVESADGYRVCIDVYDALDAVLAYSRDGTPIGEEHGYETRFIAPDIDGSRTVKGVRAVEARALDPSTDPESLEDISKKP
ncbi:molybdopterin-binding domain protein (plasmid) [Haloferax gibbonsii]|uniref:Molybdopterin-binding domain protein n=1 Tax=Haloferax gibbonsii TaxID=35746 RepID=A0A871BL63_HALGI|nr:molybdopterin-dependent oxidoreductase [Haloferax gibbonsii]QOS13768.1 molybdopterin-binding domain protein [Haloferax gibbonsii]